MDPTQVSMQTGGHMMSAVVFIFNATSTADTDQSQYSESSMLLRLFLRLADMRGIMSRRPHGCGYGVSSHQVSRHPVESLAKPINHPRQITRAYRKTTENHELPTEACASLHQRNIFSACKFHDSLSLSSFPACCNLYYKPSQNEGILHKFAN